MVGIAVLPRSQEWKHLHVGLYLHFSQSNHNRPTQKDTIIDKTQRGKVRERSWKMIQPTPFACSCRPMLAQTHCCRVVQWDSENVTCPKHPENRVALEISCRFCKPPLARSAKTKQPHSCCGDKACSKESRSGSRVLSCKKFNNKATVKSFNSISFDNVFSTSSMQIATMNGCRQQVLLCNTTVSLHSG